MHSEKYKSVRAELIELFESNPEPESLVEISYVASRLHELGLQMDTIAAKAVLEKSDEYVAVPTSNR